MKNNREDVLYQQFLSGDETALEKAYLAYKEEFINFFKSYDISTEVVLDIYQDSMVVVFQKFVNEKFRLENSSLKTYIFGIGKNKVYDHFKIKQKKTRLIDDVQIGVEAFKMESPPNSYEKSLAKNLKLISESCRHILELFYYKNLSIKEIVLTTDYKDENTVKSHKSRCMKKLKALCKSN